MAIFYLHGFASSGVSEKSLILREHFPDERVLAPDLPVDPSEVITLIDGLVRQAYQDGEKKFLFIGTSLGGFYAWYFAAKYDCPAFLVNPSILPHESLSGRVGTNKNFKTGEDFVWEASFNETLAGMRDWAEVHSNGQLVNVAVAADDELLDTAATYRFFVAAKVRRYYAFEDGGHRFNGFDRLLGIIADLYSRIVEAETLV